MYNQDYDWPIIEEEVDVIPAPERETSPREVAAPLIPEDDNVDTPISQDGMQNNQVSLMVELPKDGSAVSLDHEEVVGELCHIASTIIGHSKFLNMGKSGLDLVDEDLVPILPGSLRDLQKKEKRGIEEILKILEDRESPGKSTNKDKLLKGKVLEFFFLLCLRLKNTTSIIFAQERLLKESLKEICFLLSTKLEDNETSSLLSPLLSSLPELLRQLKENSRSTFTMAEVKNEASKLIYLHMRRKQMKLPTHPEYIVNIPSYWNDEQMDVDKTSLCYISKKIGESIQDYTGLGKDQVDDVFANHRKREAPKDEKLGDALNKKKAFTTAVTDVFRKWKANNPLKNLPNKTDLVSLVKDTGKNEKQILNWFNNHAPGREERNQNKKRKRGLPV